LEKLLEIGSWIAGIGSFFVAVYMIWKKISTTIKQDNKDGDNTIEVTSDRKIESIEQKNISGDNEIKI
jgi:hypothetical protein